MNCCLSSRFTQETYPDVCLNHMPWVSRPGGDLCVLTMPAADRPPRVRTILNGVLGPGHVHGMDLSWDGRRIVFGYAKARGSDPPEGWLDRRTNFDLRRNQEPIHLFEIGVDGGGLRQITAGHWSDLDPTYAPSGDVVFVSERCGASLQCNEYDKDETSCNLYACRPDGSDIRRLSVSKDGDYLPHALADGTIGYTRWEYQERGWAHVQSIWFIRPDGTGADALFKQHLNDPWAAGRRAFDPRHGDPSPGGGGHRASHAGGRTGRHRDAERGDERSGGDSHRHTRGASPGGRHVGRARLGGRRLRPRRHLHAPLAAFRAALPRLVLLRQADRPDRLRPLPDRRLRRQGVDLPGG